jgi:hypothetical protein
MHGPSTADVNSAQQSNASHSRPSVSLLRLKSDPRPSWENSAMPNCSKRCPTTPKTAQSASIEKACQTRRRRRPMPLRTVAPPDRILLLTYLTHACHCAYRPDHYDACGLRSPATNPCQTGQRLLETGAFLHTLRNKRILWYRDLK